jgi:hypothetical protein
LEKQGITVWCGKSWGFQYEFDNFYGEFNTENDFELSKTELNWLWYNLIKNNIIKIYEQKNTEWFTESIIISKKDSDKDLETFAKENIENVNISWLKVAKWKFLEIDCNGTSLDLVYFQWKYDMNQYDIYITDGFLKVWQWIYTISYATLDEKSRNDFSSNFKTIKCK